MRRTKFQLKAESIRVLTLRDQRGVVGGARTESTVHDQGCQCWPDPPPAAVQRE